LPFREPTLLLQDILDSVKMIEAFTAGMGLEAFREDPKTIAAVERKLLLIAEAPTRLGDQGPLLCPGQRWRDIRGMGNWLRHQYDRVDIETVWNTVTDDLPPLKAAVGKALASNSTGPASGS
jgi:uncharacterized protein with HEPN domain